MKKLFVASALALALTMASHQRASAWSEFKFGVGLNFGWVGGGNSVLWGAYRSAPTPGGQDLPSHYLGSVPAAPGYGGFDHAPAAPDWHPPVPHADAQPMPSGPANYGVQQAFTPYYSGYQPASYTVPSYYQAPTYWYGR
jgi:hypothetical protein